jgi:putative zinc finger protein
MEPNTLPCQEVVELVTEYLERTLLPEMQTKVDEHLAQASQCFFGEKIQQNFSSGLSRTSREDQQKRRVEGMTRFLHRSNDLSSAFIEVLYPIVKNALSTAGRECIPDYAPADFTSRIKRVASLRSSCSTV